MNKFFFMIMNKLLGGLILFFLCISASLVSFADESNISPTSSIGLATGGAINSQDFGAQVAQNTQKGLQIFSGVNTASFLKTEDSDFAGFGEESSQDNKFPVDISSQDLSEKQSDVDAQIEGDWNE